MIIKQFKSVLYFSIYLSCVYSISWENLTSNLDATDIAIHNNKIYITTAGGLIILNKENDTFNNLDFDDNIYPVDLKSIFIDSNENILLGSNGPIASIQLLNNPRILVL